MNKGLCTCQGSFIRQKSSPGMADNRQRGTRGDTSFPQLGEDGGETAFGLLGEIAEVVDEFGDDDVGLNVVILSEGVLDCQGGVFIGGGTEADPGVED